MCAICHVINLNIHISVVVRFIIIQLYSNQHWLCALSGISLSIWVINLVNLFAEYYWRLSQVTLFFLNPWNLTPILNTYNNTFTPQIKGAAWAKSWQWDINAKIDCGDRSILTWFVCMTTLYLAKHVWLSSLSHEQRNIGLRW